MANITSLLKTEITRLARKEVRSETEALKKSSAKHRSEIAALKRQISTLQQQLARLGKGHAKIIEVSANSGAAPKVRFSAKALMSLRNRLGLSAEAIGILLDVSAQTIYSWEAGKTSPRAGQLERYAMLRGKGKREVDAILKELAAQATS